MTIVITGSLGGLGRYLSVSLSEVGTVVGLARSTGNNDNVISIDLNDTVELGQVLSSVAPSVIVHLAALTDVNFCQLQPQRAFKSNVTVTRSIVDWIRYQAPSTRLIYVSTDQVYGETSGIHRENEIGPVNIYGWSKLLAEDLVRMLKHHLILRLNYVGRGTSARPGFIQWLVKNLSEKAPITLFNDVLFNPLSAGQVAKLFPRLITEKVNGTLNLGASGLGMSKAEFAITLAEGMGLPTEFAQVGGLQDGELIAPRPLDTRMDVSAAQKFFSLPDMETVIESIAEDIKDSVLGNDFST